MLQFAFFSDTNLEGLHNLIIFFSWQIIVINGGRSRYPIFTFLSTPHRACVVGWQMDAEKAAGCTLGSNFSNPFQNLY